MTTQTLGEKFKSFCYLYDKGYQLKLTTVIAYLHTFRNNLYCPEL